MQGAAERQDYEIVDENDRIALSYIAEIPKILKRVAGLEL